MNNHDGTFREEALHPRRGTQRDGQEMGGMGMGVGDYNLDGHTRSGQDALHESGDRPLSQRWEGQLRRRDHRGWAQQETRFISWGAGLADFDNDGYPDISGHHGQCLPRTRSRLAQVSQRAARASYFAIGATAHSPRWGRRPVRASRRAIAAAAAPLATSITTATWTY